MECRFTQVFFMSIPLNHNSQSRQFCGFLGLCNNNQGIHTHTNGALNLAEQANVEAGKFDCRGTLFGTTHSRNLQENSRSMLSAATNWPMHSPHMSTKVEIDAPNDRVSRLPPVSSVPRNYRTDRLANHLLVVLNRGLVTPSSNTNKVILKLRVI